MAQILDGREVSAAIKETLKREVSAMVDAGMRPPHLVAILVGNDGGSMTYVGAKEKACHEVGFLGSVIRYDDTVTEAELLEKIDEINNDSQIDGLIVQLPLPSHIDENKVTLAISPAKDVDGFHDVNMGRLTKGADGVKPATPYGITLILKHYGIETAGKNVVVVGRSNIVGRPMSIMLSGPGETGNATVTVTHSRTVDLASYTRNADILVAAIGKPGFITGDMVKPGAVVIDVGTTRITDPSKKAGWRLSGDVDFASTEPVAGAITPVPGGVGPMTIAGLLANTLLARKAGIAARTA
ncbi:MAG: bifunctional 5,10-methylenetetrahydrofolate dehydrogenase/5,10-methenyltetrahydrofolate cyclohydrolase [Bacteroidia bacterium]|nr:bifunctional 5,10-methylenetetrahydrofolate dehydrogenase/5,10-methenyltetrahydrofolate cyclohydrolase [Bacteroidia bacterium]